MSDFVWGFFEYCGDVQPAEGGIKGYMCTLPRGHDGWHEAAGNDWVETWPPKESLGVPAEAVEMYEHARKKASELQQGGSHYCARKIQPIDYALANEFNYWESAALKYLTRHRDKNGSEDLRKAIHCIQLGLEREYGE